MSPSEHPGHTSRPFCAHPSTHCCGFLTLLAPQNAVLHLKRTHTSLVLGLCGCSPPVGQVGTFTGSGTPRPARRCAAFEARGVN
jgi:hypothetical protein